MEIPDMIEHVTKLRLEEDWPTMGRMLPILHKRLKSRRFKEVLRGCEISERTYYYLSNIMGKIDGMGLTIPEGLGWRKTAVIANRFVTSTEPQALLEQAAKLKHSELRKL